LEFKALALKLSQGNYIMIDFITLFQKHNLNSGNINQIKCQNNSKLCYFYSRQNPTQEDLNTLASLNEEHQILHNINILLQKNGGGLIVQAEKDGEIQKVTIKGIFKEDYIRPEKMVVLHPTDGKKIIPINYGKTETYPPHSHIIIPVDKVHQDNLNRFLNYLSWYTPDFENLILHTIRNPLLEGRISVLEENMQKLQSPKRVETPLQTDSTDNKKAGWFKLEYLPTAAIIVLLIAQLVMSSFFFYNQHNQQKPNSDANQIVSNNPSPATTVQKPSPAKHQKSPNLDYNTIVTNFFRTFQEVVKKNPNKKAYNKLWETHFKVLNPTYLNDENFVWGITKLWLILHSDVKFKGNEDFLTGAFKYNATKKQFREYLKKREVTKFSKLPNIQVSQSMLAELACQIQHTSDKTKKFRGPGLPPINTNPSFLFEQNPNCSDSVELSKIIPGLKALTEKLKAEL